MNGAPLEPPVGQRQPAQARPAAAAVLIRTTGERQTMDWSLALASQDIPSVIHSPSTARGAWALEVDADDAGRALRILRLYHIENRYRPSPITPAVGDLLFHWGVLAWCLVLVLVHLVADAPDSPLRLAGAFDTSSTTAGQWWRPITATFLHSGPEHLAANLTTGFLLIGLAMGRFGTGPALLLSLLAGIGGNLFAWGLRPRPYVGLGASGVVMGALGLLAFALVADARRHLVSRGTLVRGVLGGLLLFILFGTAPESDVLAHLGGFISGCALAGGFSLLPTRLTRAPALDLLTALVYLLIGAGAWYAAVHEML